MARNKYSVVGHIKLFRELSGRCWDENFTMGFRCRAFRGEGVRLNRCRLDVTGIVRVYDDYAKIFTMCHSLSLATQKKIAKIMIDHNMPAELRAIAHHAKT